MLQHTRACFKPARRAPDDELGPETAVRVTHRVRAPRPAARARLGCAPPVTDPSCGCCLRTGPAAAQTPAKGASRGELAPSASATLHASLAPRGARSSARLRARSLWARAPRLRRPARDPCSGYPTQAASRARQHAVPFAGPGCARSPPRSPRRGRDRARARRRSPSAAHASRCSRLPAFCRTHNVAPVAPVASIAPVAHVAPPAAYDGPGLCTFPCRFLACRVVTLCFARAELAGASAPRSPLAVRLWQASRWACFALNPSWCACSHDAACVKLCCHL